MENIVIERVINGQKVVFELTNEEQLNCVRAFRRNFYREVIQYDYEVKENEIEDIVQEADELYCEGQGYTEYEALEVVLSKWGY